ncbi:MAG: HNH endonuclease, partial [Pseudomonadota bacterium]
MSKPRKNLNIPRKLAFSKQNGLCYYCNQPMWTKDSARFALKYHKKISQILGFQCTGEHLTPHSVGGTTNQKNIVAACRFCNQQRHKRKVILDPKGFKSFIQVRLSRGKWNA